MPTYEFEDVETGEELEIVLGADEAPRIGDPWVVRGPDGAVARCLVRVVRTAPQGAPKADRHFKAISAPPWAPGAARYDDLGAPLIDGRRELEEFKAVNGVEYD